MLWPLLDLMDIVKIGLKLKLHQVNNRNHIKELKDYGMEVSKTPSFIPEELPLKMKKWDPP